MAKNDDFDIDFGDFDDDLGFDEGDSKPLTRIEKTKRAFKGFKGGALEALKDPNVIVGILGRAIPSDYGIDPKVALTAAEDIGTLMRKAKAEGDKVNNELKQSVADSSEDLKKFLSPKQYERAMAYANSRERKTFQKTNAEDDAVAAQLGDMFAQQSAEEQGREQREYKRDVQKIKIGSAQHGESIEALGEVHRQLLRQNSFNENVTARYYRKSLEIGVRHYHVATQMLLAMRDNAQVTQDNLMSIFKAISKPEVVKLQEHELTRQKYGGGTGARSVFGGGTGIVERVRENAMRRATEMINSAGQMASMAVGFNPLAMAGGMLTPNQLYEEGGSLVGKGAVRFAGGLAADRVRRMIGNSERGKRFGGNSKYLTQNFRRILEERYLKGEANELSFDEDGNEVKNRLGPLVKIMRDLIGDDRGSRSIDVDSVQSLQEPHPFTKQSNRTLNEVIPGLLSNILGEIIHFRTGKPAKKLTYDYAESKFVSEADRGKKVTHEFLRTGDGDLVKDRTSRLIDQIDPEGKLDPALRRKIGEQLLSDNYNNRLASVDRLSSAGTFKDLSPEDAKRVAGLFGSHFEGDVNNQKLNDFSDGFNSLLAGSNINRDQVQGLINTGNRKYLEQAGFIKDGVIDQQAIMRAMLAHDYDGVDSSLTRSLDLQRAEKQAAEDKAKAEAGRWKGHLDNWKGKITGRMRGGLGAEEGQSSGAAFAERAREMRDRVEKMYKDSNLAQRVSDLSDEAVQLLDEHGIDISKENLSGKARDLLAKHGLLEKAEGLRDKAQELNKRTRRGRTMGRRKARQAAQAARGYYGQAQGYAGQAAQAARDFDPQQAKAEAARRLKKAHQTFKDEGFRGFIPASVEGIQGRVMQALKEFDPKEVTTELIEKATELAVDGKGRLKDLDELRRDLTDVALIKGAIAKGDIQDGLQSRGGLRGIMSSIKDRLKKAGVDAKNVTQEKVAQATVQAEAIGESVGEKFDDVGQQIRDAINEVKETLVKQHEEEKERLEGPRVGSYEDLMSKKKDGKGGLADLAKEKFDKSESGFGLLAMLGGGLKKLLIGAGLGPIVKLASLAIPLVSGLVKAGGLLGKGVMALGGLLAKIPGLGGLGALAAKLGGSKVGQIAKGVGKAAIFGVNKKTLWSGTKLAGRGAWGAAKMVGRGAMAVGRFLPLLATPAGIAAMAGVAAVGAVGYGAYKAYKWFTRIKPTELNNYRMVQYGFERDDGASLRKIAEFESLVLQATKFQGEQPKVDWQKVAWKDVFKIFGIDPKDKESGDAGHFEEWVISRFNPVFSVWAGVTRRITGGTDFEKAEDLKGQQLKDFVEGIRFTDFEYATDIINPLTKEPITMDSRDVRGLYDELKAWSDKKADDKSLLAKAGAGLLAGAKAAWGGLKKANVWINDKVGAGVNKVLDTIDPSGRAKELAGKVKDFLTKPLISDTLMASIKTGLGAIAGFFVRALGIDQTRRINRMNAFDSIRLRMYGLITMDYPKVRTIFELEDFCQQSINYRKTEGVEFEGTVAEAAEKFHGKFGITDKKSEEMSEWRSWFSLRFLPVFVNSCAVVKKLTNENTFYEGCQKLSKTDRLEAAKFIIGTVTDDGGKASTVWQILVRPWPDSPVNTDPKSIDANLRFLEQEAMAVVLAEDKAAEQRAAQQNKPGEKPNPLDQGGEPFDPNSVKTAYGGGSAGGNVSSADYGGLGSMSSGPGVSISQGREGKAAEIATPKGSGYNNLKDTLDQAAEMVGIDPKMLGAVVAVESGMNPNALEPNTKAAGLGQAIPSTWQHLIKRYGPRYGLGPDTSPMDPVANALMTAEYIKENVTSIQSAIKGRPVQPLDAYMAHFLGPAGYKTFLTANPNDPADKVRPAAAKSNPEIFYHDGKRRSQPRTVGEVMALMGGKLSQRAQEFGVIAKGESLNLAMAGGAGTGAGSALPGGASDAVASTRGQGQPDNSPGATRDRLLTMSETAEGRSINSPMAVPAGSSAIPNMDGVQNPGQMPTSNSQQQGPKVASNGMPIDPSMSKAKGSAGDAMLVRERSTESGTYGVLTLPDGTKMNTLELPWKDNKPRESCIPPGTYECTIRQSPKFGTVYEVQGVSGRSAILFHAGNSAGDASRGLKADSQGCILLGLGRAARGIQQIITQSQSAVKLFMERLAGRSFRLTITGGGEAGSSASVQPNGSGESIENATGANTGASSPFSSSNPFDQARSAPVPSSSSAGAAIPSMPYSGVPSSDVYSAPSSSQPQSGGAGEILMRSYDVQTKMLDALVGIKTAVERLVAEGGGSRELSNDERLRLDAKEKSQAANQETTRRVNATSNTPSPAVSYLRQV